LAAYAEFNDLITGPAYSDADRDRMRDLLLSLGVFYRNTHGAIRRRPAPATSQWAWLRANRGTFDRQPADAAEDVQGPRRLAGETAQRWARDGRGGIRGARRSAE
jgi:hypothetical protein